MGSLAFGSGYFGQYALGGAVPITVTYLDPICTGHIANGENGEISDTVGGTVEENTEEDFACR